MTPSIPRGVPPAGRFALLAALFSSVGQTFFIGLFGAEFRAAFDLSDAGLGTLYSGATLASGLLMFWLGGIVDRRALRHVVIAVLAALAVGAWLVASAAGPWSLLPGLFLVRLAGQGMMGHLGVVAAGRYAVHRRGRALAMVSYGFILGEACLPPLVAWALSDLEWRVVWLASALLLASIAAPLMWWMARPLTGNPAADLDAAAGEPDLGRRALLTSPVFQRVLLVVLVPPVVVTAAFLHQGAVAERMGWSLLDVGRAFVGFALAQAGAAFLAGRLIDRFSARGVLRVQLLPLGLGMVALGWAPPAAALWLMFLGLGVTAGFNGVTSAAVWVELFGTRQLGMIRGVYSALMVLGTAIGPIALGAALDVGISLAAIGLSVLAWTVIVAPLATPGVLAARRARALAAGTRQGG
ncbi:MAG: MFS transporter [Wenzhouxiangellaceae bacterium]|nr:MFS transporter [Wenzhouxiangellaceae bacterium]